MNRNNLPSISATPFIWCFVLLFLCAIYLVFTLGLTSGARLDVPFTYAGDGLEYNLLTKTVIETGWWLENPMTGAPGILEMYDYAIGNNLDFLVMKIISLFSGNYAVVMNLYYILGFFLTAVFSLFTFRQLRISYPLSVFGSILFTFIYYHFNRIGHYNLTAYYMVPLMVLVVLWVCQGESLFIKKSGKGIHISVTIKGYLSVVIVLIASTHSYYGYFGLLFLAVATLWSASRSYDLIPFINGVIAGTLLALFAILNKLPSILYTMQHGPSFVMSYRYAYESEIWGLKLIQLLLPAPGHRFPFLADIAQKYTEYRPLVNENVSASLGIIGSIGLIVLLSWIFIRGFPLFRKKLGDRTSVMDQLSLLTISAILIGTIGGISAIIAQVFPEIHSYNRISVYISFFTLLAVIIILQMVYEQYRTMPLFCPAFLVLLLVVLTCGVFDQVPEGYALTAGSEREQNFLANEVFFSQIEELMPDGASIFIIPDIGGFPNSNPPGKIQGLDSLKPYLHTHSLKWSYPTMKGRFWDNWQVAVSVSEPSALLDHLFITGFTGLLVDGYGYNDGGKATVDAYQNLTETTPLVSADGRYAFFDLTGFMNKKKSAITPEQYTAEKENYIQTMQEKPELQNPMFGVEIRNKLSS